MFDRSQLLKSIINCEEKIIFAKVLDQAQSCIRKKIPTFSDFLDPAKLNTYANLLIKIEDIKYKVFGGYQDSERSIIGFYPEYMELTNTDFPICAIQVNILDKFCEGLTHREFLGSIIGTGIERTKLGDIVVLEECAYVFLNQSIADYICVNLSKVSRTKVQNSIIELSNIKLPEKKCKQIHQTVSSLRVDAVISAAFNISRGHACEFINAEKVSVNWSIVKSNSQLVKEGDIFTLRGHGRAKIIEITGKTKKDKIGINIQVYV